MAGTNNSWNNQIAGSYNQIILNAGTNGVAISTDASAATVNVATGGAVKTTTLGSTNTTSATTVQSGSGALNITSTNGALTINSGTGTIGISNDATNTTVNIASGAGAKVVQVGSTNGASSLALKTGTADFSLASATGTIMSALDTGEITYPLQCCFSAYKSSNSTNATGDGTEVTIVCDTEVVDQNSDYNNSTGTFTAPVTGTYLFSAGVQFASVGAATSGYIILVSNNTLTTYVIWQGSPATLKDGSGNGGITGSFVVKLNSGETMVLKASLSGTTKTVTIRGLSNYYTYFSGYLVA